MTYKKSHNWPKLRRKAKKIMRKRYKKTIKLTDLDKVWNDYVEYGIVRPLLKYGKVDVDDKMSIEIVGRPIENVPKAFNLASKGLQYTAKHGVTKIKTVNYNRQGLHYKIEVKDSNYKEGKLIYISDDKLRKRVADHLANSHQYYRIETNNHVNK